MNFEFKYLKYKKKYIDLKNIFVMKGGVSSDNISLNEHSTKEYVLHTVRQIGWLLKHASDELKDDEEVVRAAIGENYLALQFASDRLQNDSNFILDLVRRNYKQLQIVKTQHKDDYNIILRAIEDSPRAYFFASDRIQNEPSIVYAAVEHCSMFSVFKYLSNKHKDDENIVLKSVERYGYLLEYASNRLKNNFDIVLKAVKEYPDAVQYASDRLKKDLYIMIKARSAYYFDNKINILDTINLNLGMNRLSWKAAHYCYHTLGISLERLIEDGVKVYNNINIIINALDGSLCDIKIDKPLLMKQSLKSLVLNKCAKELNIKNLIFDLTVEIGDKIKVLNDPLEQTDLRNIYLRNDNTDILIVYKNPTNIIPAQVVSGRRRPTSRLKDSRQAPRK